MFQDVGMHLGLVFLSLQNSVKLALSQLSHLFVQLIFIKFRRRCHDSRVDFSFDLIISLDQLRQHFGVLFICSVVSGGVLSQFVCLRRSMVHLVVDGLGLAKSLGKVFGRVLLRGQILPSLERLLGFLA